MRAAEIAVTREGNAEQHQVVAGVNGTCLSLHKLETNRLSNNNEGPAFWTGPSDLGERVLFLPCDQGLQTR
jgi:hypothetical protein